MWVWAQNVPGEHDDREQRPVVAQDRPDREHEQQPPEDRHVRVPRQGEDCGAVVREQPGEDCGEAEQHEQAAPPPREPEHRPDDEHVEADRGRVHRPRRGPEQSVEGREQPEADRSRVAALTGDRADAAREPDERRMRGPHVPDPQLGLGHVQDREPVRVRERDQRDDERHREQRPERNDDPPAPGTGSVAGALSGVGSEAPPADDPTSVATGTGRGYTGPLVLRGCSVPIARGKRLVSSPPHEPGRSDPLGLVDAPAAHLHRPRDHRGGVPDPAPRDAAQPGRADGRGLHARLPGAVPARRAPQRRLPPPLRPGQHLGARRLVQALRGLARRPSGSSACSSSSRSCSACTRWPGTGDGPRASAARSSPRSSSCRRSAASSRWPGSAASASGCSRSRPSSKRGAGSPSMPAARIASRSWPVCSPASRCCSGSISSSRSGSRAWPRPGAPTTGSGPPLRRASASRWSATSIHAALVGPGVAFQGMVLDPVFKLRGGRQLPIPRRGATSTGSSNGPAPRSRPSGRSRRSTRPSSSSCGSSCCSRRSRSSSVSGSGPCTAIPPASGRACCSPPRSSVSVSSRRRCSESTRRTSAG